MKKKFVSILKKIPWFHIIMFFVCVGGFYHYAPVGDFHWDNNAYAAAFIATCAWILWDLVMTLSLGFFDIKRSCRTAPEVSGNE